MPGETLSRIRYVLGGPAPDGPGPKLVLLDGEKVILEGAAAVTRGMFGGRYGPLALTNKRVLWHESGLIWPLRRQHREIDLADIAAVDKGTLFDLVFGGRRIRLRRRNGKDQCFFEGDGRLDEWITAIRNEMHRAT